MQHSPSYPPWRHKRRAAPRAGAWLTALKNYRVHLNGIRIVDPACGSGALALALLLARSGTRRAFSIMQPGGSALDVRLFTENGAEMAGVDGPVALVARGKVWLPEPEACTRPRQA